MVFHAETDVGAGEIVTDLCDGACATAPPPKRACTDDAREAVRGPGGLQTPPLEPLQAGEVFAPRAQSDDEEEDEREIVPSVPISDSVDVFFRSVVRTRREKLEAALHASGPWGAASTFVQSVIDERQSAPSMLYIRLKQVISKLCYYNVSKTPEPIFPDCTKKIFIFSEVVSSDICKFSPSLDEQEAFRTATLFCAFYRIGKFDGLVVVHKPSNNLLIIGRDDEPNVSRFLVQYGIAEVFDAFGVTGTHHAFNAAYTSPLCLHTEARHIGWVSAFTVVAICIMYNNNDASIELVAGINRSCAEKLSKDPSTSDEKLARLIATVMRVTWEGTLHAFRTLSMVDFVPMESWSF